MRRLRFVLGVIMLAGSCPVVAAYGTRSIPSVDFGIGTAGMRP